MSRNTLKGARGVRYVLERDGSVSEVFALVVSAEAYVRRRLKSGALGRKVELLPASRVFDTFEAARTAGPSKAWKFTFQNGRCVKVVFDKSGRARNEKGDLLRYVGPTYTTEEEAWKHDLARAKIQRKHYGAKCRESEARMKRASKALARLKSKKAKASRKTSKK